MPGTQGQSYPTGFLRSDNVFLDPLANNLSTNNPSYPYAALLQAWLDAAATVVTVAALPAAAGRAGARRVVSNATVTTFASIVAGGGANTVPVYSDGVNWRIG